MRPATPSRSSVNRPPSGLGGGGGPGLGAGRDTSHLPASRQGRPGSRGALASRAGGMTMAGTAVGTEVNVEHRPVTQQGMAGLKTGAQGPGRQIQDRRFFLDELRAKKSDLGRVLEDLGEELDTHRAGREQFAALKKKHETVTKNVLDLQGQLADLNIVLDSVAQDTSSDVLERKQAELKDFNDVERKKIDVVYTERTAMEQRTRDTEAEIETHNRELEAKLSEMAPAKRREYNDLSGENAQLVTELDRLRTMAHEEAERVANMERALMADGRKQQALKLQDQLRELNEKKYKLDEEERSKNRSPEEQREELMNKIRADNQETERVEKECRSLVTKLKGLEKEVQSLRTSSDDAHDASETAREKYDAIVRQEAELTSFISNFDANRAGALQQIEQSEANIQHILEATSKSLNLNLPTKKRLAQMQEELTYKAQMLDNAQSTHERLHKELDVRRAEMDKIGTLEEKIGVELESLSAKMSEMNSDIERFNDSHLLKREAEETKADLEREKISLAARKDALISAAKDRYTKFEAKRNQLQENEMYLTLEKGQQRLRTVEQEYFKVQEYIASKERETDFRPMLKDLEELVDKLNVQCQRMAML
ncbi:IFT74 protein [Pseudoscourfieldia marina]